MLNREIGSEFWNVPVCDEENNIFPNNTVWYLSGRCALRDIIRDIKKNTKFESVALPSWCCDSIIIPFLNEGIKVEFYPVIFEDGELIQNLSHISACDVLLVMDYFGYRRKLEYNFDGIVINDVTHSVFCGEYRKADYTFGSLRKWAGFYTGGFAFGGDLTEKINDKSNLDYITARKLAMEEKRAYINKENSSKGFLKIFSNAEAMLENGICGKGEISDIERAKLMDINLIKSKRRENAEVLLQSLSDLAIFSELHEDDCPLFVPLLVPEEKRATLRKYLIEKEIYCPIHWPETEYHNLTTETEELYKQEISIVCDQRYSTRDMIRICQEINVFLGRGN